MHCGRLLAPLLTLQACLAPQTDRCPRLKPAQPPALTGCPHWLPSLSALIGCCPHSHVPPLTARDGEGTSSKWPLCIVPLVAATGKCGWSGIRFWLVTGVGGRVAGVLVVLRGIRVLWLPPPKSDTSIAVLLNLPDAISDAISYSIVVRVHGRPWSVRSAVGVVQQRVTCHHRHCPPPRRTSCRCPFSHPWRAAFCTPTQACDSALVKSPSLNREVNSYVLLAPCRLPSIS